MNNLWLVLLCFLISCGKGSGTTLETNQQTSIPTPAAVMEHKKYIIGGQSNAVRLLYTVSGYNSDPLTGTSDLVPGIATTVVGNATGSMPISYWLDPINAAPILQIISENCAANPYFIWYQGESDSDIKYLQYRDRLTAFFGIIKATCPTISIVEISVAWSNNTRMGSYIDQIIQIQQSLSGIPFVDADVIAQQYGYYFDGHHLIQSSYVALWTEITTKFPLQ